MRYIELYEGYVDLNLASEEEQIAAVQLDSNVIKYIKNPTEAVQLAAVQKNAYAIKYIENTTEAVRLVAVQRDGGAIEYIPNPSEAVQLAAVQCYGLAIQYILNPSEAVQLAAIKDYKSAIKYIENPSEAVQLAAVQHYGSAIEHIQNPSEAAQLAAVRDDELAILYIKNPSKTVILTAILKMLKNPHRVYESINFYRFFEEKYPDWPEWAAIEKSLRASKLIQESKPTTVLSLSKKPKGKAAAWIDHMYATLPKNPINPNQLALAYDIENDQGLALIELVPDAYDPDAASIKWIQTYPQRRGIGKEALEELKDLAGKAGVHLTLTAWKHGKVPERVLKRFYTSRGFKQDTKSGQLKWSAPINEAVTRRNVNKASEEEQIAAVRQDGGAIRSITNPSEAVQLAAVQQDGLAIYHIKTPSEAVQLAAVQQDGLAIYHIKTPSEAVQLAAVQQNGNAIYHIKTPSEAVQLAAVQQDGEAIKYIKNPTKTVILTAILVMYKYSNDYFYGVGIKYYREFKSKYPDWTEWAAIDKSLRASKLINESETVGYPASVLVNPIRRKTGNLAIHRGLSDLKYEGIGIGIQRKAIDPYAQEISEYLDQVLSTHSKNTLVVSQAVSLLAIGVRWPELQVIIEKHKDSILWYILTKIKNSIEEDTYSGKFIAKNAIELLKEININWPEFDGILKSLNVQIQTHAGCN